jgi:hypothetical protein
MALKSVADGSGVAVTPPSSHGRSRMRGGYSATPHRRLIDPTRCQAVQVTSATAVIGRRPRDTTVERAGRGTKTAITTKQSANISQRRSVG